MWKAGRVRVNTPPQQTAQESLHVHTNGAVNVDGHELQ